MIRLAANETTTTRRGNGCAERGAAPRHQGEQGRPDEVELLLHAGDQKCKNGE